MAAFSWAANPSRTPPATPGYHYVFSDIWLVRVDSGGSVLWQKNYGGIDSEEFSDLIALSNGDIAFVAASRSKVSGNKTSTQDQYTDWWVVRLSPVGAILWQQSLASDCLDPAYLSEAYDGGIMLAASTGALGVLPHTEVFRFGPAGEIRWQRDFWPEDNADAGPAALSQFLNAADGGSVLVKIKSSEFPWEGINSTHMEISKLAPEDCDGDGVADYRDHCLGTSVVDADGCSID